MGQDLCRNLVERLMDRKVLGINNAVYLPCTNVLFFGDAKWYWWNREAVKAFPGPKFTLNQGVRRFGHKSVEGEPGLSILPREGGQGVSWEGGLRFNRSSGACAINLAVRLGAYKVILIGYDMQPDGPIKNWMPHYNESSTRLDQDHALKGLRDMAPHIPVKVLNASPGKIDFFPRFDLDQVL